MKIIKNCIFSLKAVFRYAPLNAFLCVVGFLVPAFFTGFQMLLMQNIVDGSLAFAKGEGQLQPVIGWGILLVFMLTVWAALERVGYLQTEYIGMRLKEKMAPDIAKQLGALEYAAFEERSTHEVFQKMSREPEQKTKQVFSALLQAVNQSVSILFTMTVFYAISVWIGLGVTLIAIPMVAMALYSAKKRQKVTEEVADAKRRMAYLKGLPVNKHAMYEMKLFGAEGLLTKKWDYYGEIQETCTIREIKKATVFQTGGLLLSVVCMLFVTVMISLGLLEGTVTLGAFVAALNGSGHICSRKLTTCCMRIAELFTCSLEIDFYMDFLKLPKREDGGKITELKHYDIAFENVSFQYPGTEREILKNITFYVKEGERVAFVGENGAGKSTIIKLLCGLYEPTAGRVTIGGVPVREIAEEKRRNILSVVFQDFQSYQMTLRENVAFGNMKAMYQDEKIKKALKDADGLELAESVEKGLDRNLGKLMEDGQDLSRGQWQRVAMARAFVSDARFVILDEPTAALDPLAESHMYENFSKIFHARGTIMVSHRLASAKMADRIFVLDGGRIVQADSHEALMKEQGLYQTMYLAQSSFYVDAEAANSEAKVSMHSLAGDSTQGNIVRGGAGA